MIAVTIDGQRIETSEGRTILHVAREQGIDIPTLCYHEALEPSGACRLCVVEVEAGPSRRLVASCTHPCTDGLVVHTRSEAVQRSRRVTVELLLATAKHVPAIRVLAEEFGVGEPRFVLPEDSCILCGLCVRACKEIVGVGAISMVNRGLEKQVATPFHLASNACIRCGTCVLVCPTGALNLADVCGEAQTTHPTASEFAAVACRVCEQRYHAPRFVDHRALLAGRPLTEEVAHEEAVR